MRNTSSSPAILPSTFISDCSAKTCLVTARIGEIEDLICGRQAGVDEDAVGAGFGVSRRAVECLGATAPRDERLGAGDDAEVGIGLAILASPDLAAELLDVGQGLVAIEERVGLWKDLVLDAHRGDVALAELDHQP